MSKTKIITPRILIISFCVLFATRMIVSAMDGKWITGMDQVFGEFLAMLMVWAIADNPNK